MKISSASKKVLASALSAAMVVAFAPTVAFGATGDAISVTIDLAGGTGAQTDYSWAKQGSTINLGSPTNNGYELDHWYLDANGNGTQDSGETDINAGDTVLPTDASAVTYRAVYKGIEPSLSFGAYDSSDSVTDADGKAPAYTLGATFTDTANKANTKYTVTVAAPDGTQLGDAVTVDKTKTPADTFGAVKVFFCGNPDSSQHAQVSAADYLKSGKYTVTVKEGETAVATKTVEVVKVTYKSADGKTTVATKYYAQTKSGTTLDTGYNDADGYAVSTTKGMSGDVTLYAAANQYVGSVTYTEAAKGNGGDVAITLADTSAAAGDKYTVSVKNPSGTEVYSTAVTATAAGTVPGVEFTFDQASSTKRSASETEKAGAYSVEVTKTPKAEDAQATSSKAKMTLTEIVYTAGEGEFKGDAAKASTAKNFFTDATSGFSLNAITVNASNIKAPEGKELDGSNWYIGSKQAADASVTVGAVNTLAPKFKAETVTVAAPVVTVAKELVPNTTNQYQYKVTATSATPGAVVRYTNDGSEPASSSTAVSAAGFTVAVASAADTYKFKAFYVAGATDPSLSGKDSAVTTVVKNAYADNGTTRGTWSQDTSGSTGHNLESYIGRTSTKWLAADGVKAAIASGKAAFEGMGEYYTSTSATDATVLAQYKGLYDAVVAEANAQLAAYKDGALVVVGDKAYTMTAEKLAAAQKAVDSAAKIATGTTATANVYTTKVASVINAVNSQLKTNTEASKTAPADIKAANEVTKALKEAKTADEAKAALESYSKLTDAQKALVATADVTAAQKVVSDAETAQKLVDSQDLAAARDLNGKKVTAKAKVGKKAQGKSFAYKLAASESGATASYAKVSGSKYIKISKSGKVTFSKVKVAKKAKTYKAKVSVTYGTQTVTKTVQLVVKKK